MTNRWLKSLGGAIAQADGGGHEPVSASGSDPDRAGRKPAPLDDARESSSVGAATRSGDTLDLTTETRRYERPVGSEPRTVPVDLLHPNPMQPRRQFDEQAIRALAASIKENGLLQPILVRRHPQRSHEYEIVSGERRWRAAQLAQLREIPILVRELSGPELLELALIENLQREDLTPIEKADSYRRLIEEFKHTQEYLAQRLGQSRSHVANTLRLLQLPEAVRDMLHRGELTAGHARPLLNAEHPEELARRVAAEGLNVRETERLAKRFAAGRSTKKRTLAVDGPEAEGLKRDLSAMLGLKVTISFQGQGGSLTIHYSRPDQLADILHRLKERSGHSSSGMRASA